MFRLFYFQCVICLLHIIIKIISKVIKLISNTIYTFYFTRLKFIIIYLTVTILINPGLVILNSMISF